MSIARQERDGKQRYRRSFFRAESGSAAVEFALLAVPFFAFLFALIETCIIYFATSNLDSVVANAGRLVRTGQAQHGGMTESDFKNFICARLTLVGDCENDLHVDVRNFSTFNNVNFPPLIDEDGNVVENTAFQLGNAGDIVLVRVYYTWGVIGPSLIGFSNVEGGGRLVAASVAFRNEPFGDILPSS